MNKIHIIILLIVLVIFLIPVNCEKFDPNLIKDDKNDEKFYYESLKTKIIQTVKDKINTYDKDLVNQIKDIYNMSQNKPIDERKDSFIKSTINLFNQDNMAKDENKKSETAKKYSNLLNDMNETLDFMYWELKMAPLKTIDQDKIIRLAMVSDHLIYFINLDKTKYFKPDTSRDLIKKTVQTLISNYNITQNKKVDGSIEEIHEIPLPYDDVTVNGKTTKGIKSLV